MFPRELKRMEWKYWFGVDVWTCKMEFGVKDSVRLG